MNKILLYSIQSDNIKVSIEAYFDADGNLIVDGYDIGKTVQKYWGDSDYEYNTTVPKDEVSKLYVLLSVPNGDVDQLLSALKSRFNSNRCYSQLRDFLSQNAIRHNSFSWM